MVTRERREFSENLPSFPPFFTNFITPSPAPFISRGGDLLGPGEVFGWGFWFAAEGFLVRGTPSKSVKLRRLGKKNSHFEDAATRSAASRPQRNHSLGTGR